MSHIEEVENSSDAAEHTSKADDLPAWCHRDHWGILPSVDVIVHASADVLNLRDALNRNLLQSAAHHGNVEICGALLAHSDFKLVNDLSTRKWSALFLCSWNRRALPQPCRNLPNVVCFSRIPCGEFIT